MQQPAIPAIDAKDRANRRRFFGLAGLTTAGLASLPTGPASAAVPGPSQRDVAILRFLAAAELIETDLWQQYAELSAGNPAYKEALEAIDDDLPVYNIDVTEVEQSHAKFINAFLRSIGEHGVDLDRFRVIPSPTVTGLNPIPRLTNLTDLTVDTSYFRRYQGTKNPDFGATFAQVATIRNQPAIPTSNGLNDATLGAIVRVAAFHFASIEQGGTSLYDQFVPFVSSKQVLRIVSSIYATEAIHYAIFRDSLGGVTAFTSGDGKLVVPDLTEGNEGSSHVFPKPCDFLDMSLPQCSVIRPSSRANAGAVATVRALTTSNLFKGQSDAFFRFIMALAKAADGVG